MLELAGIIRGKKLTAFPIVTFAIAIRVDEETLLLTAVIVPRQQEFTTTILAVLHQLLPS
jgi:hypothetical protein